jgi:hypothetical protein
MASIINSPQINYNNGIMMNSSNVTSNITIPDGYNAVSAGPMTIADNVFVTIANTANWTIA